MESESVIQFGRGFSIVLGTGLPLPPARRGNGLTVDCVRKSLGTIHGFKFRSGQEAANRR